MVTTVTGFTAERMLQIENNSIVAGTIVGDDLILTRQGGAQVNAGNVRGPVGPQGPIGEISQADLDAALASFSAGSGAIADGAVTEPKLATNAVTTTKIADGAVTGSKIPINQINNAHLAANSVDSGQYVDGSIDPEHLANNAVTQAKLASDAVSTIKIVDNAVTTAKLANDSVTAAKLGPGSVDSTALANDAVTGTKIANDAINSEHYVTGSIDPEHLAASAVTGDKIANLAVSYAKLDKVLGNVHRTSNLILETYNQSAVSTGTTAPSGSLYIVTASLDITWADNVETSGDLVLFYLQVGSTIMDGQMIVKPTIVGPHNHRQVVEKTWMVTNSVANPTLSVIASKTTDANIVTLNGNAVSSASHTRLNYLIIKA